MTSSRKAMRDEMIRQSTEAEILRERRVHKAKALERRQAEALTVLPSIPRD